MVVNHLRGISYSYRPVGGIDPSLSLQKITEFSTGNNFWTIPNFKVNLNSTFSFSYEIFIFTILGSSA